MSAKAGKSAGQAVYHCLVHLLLPPQINALGIVVPVVLDDSVSAFAASINICS